MAIADRRPLRRIGGVLLAALTFCARRLRATGCGAGPVRSSVRRLPPACSRATARKPVPTPIRLACSAVSGRRRGQRLRPRHGLLRADLRRPLFPAATPCRRDAGRAVQVVLPGGQDHGVLRQQDRHRGRAKRHALRRSRQRLRLSRQGERRLLLQRQGRARARPRRRVRAIRPCGRATSLRPTTVSPPTRGKSRTAEFTPIGTVVERMGAAAVRGEGAAGAAEREDRAGGQ